MQHEMGINFVQVCNLIQGVVVIQFPAMKMIIQNNKFYALQTDTLEGWILQGDSETFKWNTMSPPCIVILLVVMCQFYYC
jgi:hypothetical protein